MPTTFSVGGLVSGIDFNQLIDQILEIDKRSIDLLELRQDQYEAQKSAFEQLNSLLDALETTVKGINDVEVFDVFSAVLSSSDPDVTATDLLSLTTDEDASPGTFTVKINQLAEATKLSSQSFSDDDAALGLSGDILINGEVLTIAATDSLKDIRTNINNLDAGVTATILSLSSADKRLILTSDTTGADQFFVLDASTTDVLQSLGLTDGTTSLKNVTSGGSLSDSFSSISTAVNDMLDLASANSGTVTIHAGKAAAFTVSLDLSKSLTDLEADIDAAAGSDIASIKSTTTDGVTTYQLKIASTSFTDASNVLETMGVLVGGQSSVAETLTGSAQNTSGGSAITVGSLIVSIDGAGVVSGDTITIQGKDHSGSAVAATTFTVSGGSTVSDLLSDIETAFGLSGGSASVSASGEIVVTDSTTGESLLEVELIANNENGGTLDFGTMDVSTQGYAMELAAGQDANLTVDGVTVTRSTNTVSDVVQGVTLNLHKADSSTTVTAQVSRDVATISESIGEVITAYNSVIDFINNQNLLDEQSESAGILQGDSTLLNVRSSLVNIITSAITGISDDINALSIVGINSNRDGKLSLNSTTFKNALSSDFDEVRNLFLVNAITTDSNVDFVSSTEGTDPGTYDISISQLATKSEVVGTSNLSGGLTVTAALTVTFAPTGAQTTVDFEAGDDIDVIVDRLNTEFDRRAQETHVADAQNLTGGSAVLSSTTFSAIDGAAAVAGDTISFTGTNRLGSAVSGVFTIADPTSDTIGQFFSYVEAAYGHAVDLSLDDGYLVFKDVSTGASSLSLSITEGNEGGGSLDLGSLTTSNSSTNVTGEEGRAEIALTASKDGSNQLVITADAYGSSNGFTVTDSTELGIQSANYVAGVDVAGTINGESATGSGRVLTGNGGDGAATDGLAISVAGTTTGSRGTISITKGVAEKLQELLEFLTSSVTGNIPSRIDNIDNSVDFIQDRIDRQQQRIESKRDRLTKQFVNMETALAGLQTINNFLAQSLLQLPS